MGRVKHAVQAEALNGEHIATRLHTSYELSRAQGVLFPLSVLGIRVPVSMLVKEELIEQNPDKVVVSDHELDLYRYEAQIMGAGFARNGPPDLDDGNNNFWINVLNRDYELMQDGILCRMEQNLMDPGVFKDILRANALEGYEDRECKMGYFSREEGEA